MNTINLRNYGDIDNVKDDAKTMQDILNRQGSTFVIDCMAESVGWAAVEFKFDSTEKQRVVSSILSDLENALWERI